MKHISDLNAVELREAAKKFKINPMIPLKELRKRVAEKLVEESLKEFKARRRGGL